MEIKMKEMWDKRYSESDFVYGKEPNAFLKEQIEGLTPGKLLLLGEGEGRNAIFAAKLGWQVDAVDYSETAKVKALKFAESENVEINYTVEDLRIAELKLDYYDAVGLIFLHLSEEIRESVHKKVVNTIKPNGIVVLQAYEKEQIKNSSGGPKNVELLYSLEDIYTDFQDLEIIKFGKETVSLREGTLHTGPAAVINFAGQKK